MKEDAKYVITQWGSRARRFSDYSEPERQALLQNTAALLSRIRHSTDIQCFLSYGALLGAVREGKLIGHDFDIDVVFFADKSLVCETSLKLLDFLSSVGLRVTLSTNGQFKSHGVNKGQPYTVEFFAAWADGDSYYQNFALRGDANVSEVLPPSTVTLEGVEFPAPRNCESHLASIYGQDWRVPNPDFRYNLKPGDFKPFSFLFANSNKKFWDEYYKNGAGQNVFLEEPSYFARDVSAKLKPAMHILDIGCGNGRDGLYFAELGCDVTLCDYSQNAIAHCDSVANEKLLNVTTQVLNITDGADTVAFAKSHAQLYDVVYARFFLHAISDLGRKNLFFLSKNVLKQGGVLLVEYRALPEGVRQQDYETKIRYENGKHFRRLLSRVEVDAEANQAGLVIESSFVSYGLAKFRNEDPLIGRLEAKNGKGN